MVAYSFKQQFVAPILSGAKRQTIRAERKRHARPGEQIQLYTAMRTKYCTAVGTATCEAVLPITIDLLTDRIMTGGTVFRSQANLDDFARVDGFKDWEEMRAFWLTNHGPDLFLGAVIRWTDFKEPK